MFKWILADDEPTIRNGLARLVPTFGLPIELAGVATDGKEALNLIERVHPDLMLVDINMPHINGLDLVEQALALLPHSKVIIISGYDQFEYARRALQLGVFDYILKPVNRAVLCSSLTNAIRSIEQRNAELTRPQSQTQESGDLIDRALRQIHNRYADPTLSLTELAQSLHVSSGYLSKGVKQRTGENFSDYMTKLRMEQAVELLSATGVVTIFDVAERVGYASQHYFCRVFKEFTGKTPSDFRKEIREKLKKEEQEQN